MVITNFKLDKMTFVVTGVMAMTEGVKSGCSLERLFVDGVELTPEQSLNVRNHSPNGFAWGYSGSGAAQTALAICLHIFHDVAVAEAVYQDFKREFVSQWPLAEPFNAVVDLTNFLLDHWPTIAVAYKSE